MTPRQADHLSWSKDRDCIAICECAIDWLTTDGPDFDPATTLKEFLTDLLGCVEEPYKQDARNLLAKIGE